MLTMPPTTPIQYFRRRTQKKRSSKPTLHPKIASLPSILINPQSLSPLFTHLPAELRTMIYHHALLAHPDPRKPYTRHSYHYRPTHTHAPRISTPLLLTCRRIYLETSLLPISLNTHTIYGGETSHAPPNSKPYLFPINTLRTTQREAIREIHLFAHQYWLEDWNERDQWHDFCRSWSGGPGPEKLRITIRHTDWWYYLLGARSPLALDPRRAGRAGSRSWTPHSSHPSRNLQEKGFEEGSWGTRFTYFCGLKVFELELETLESKKSEVVDVVTTARDWR
ncbi:MAG: hypothetical protein Q9164_004076, partial [Protoblastenia rupestris]